MPYVRTDRLLRIFAGGSILKTVSEEEIADEIIKLAEEYEKNTGRID